MTRILLALIAAPIALVFLLAVALYAITGTLLFMLAGGANRGEGE